MSLLISLARLLSAKSVSPSKYGDSGDKLERYPGSAFNSRERRPVVYIHAEDPELNRQYADEMAAYMEEAEGTYCPMCMS
jgi:hypothetical protein